MYSPEISKNQDLRYLELSIRLLYFLRDIGIKSATQPANDVWNKYARVLEALILSEMPDSQ